MQKLDGEIEGVNGWIDGADKKMDEIDSRGPNDAVLKVVKRLIVFTHVVCDLRLRDPCRVVGIINAIHSCQRLVLRGCKTSKMPKSTQGILLLCVEMHFHPCGG